MVYSTAKHSIAPNQPKLASPVPMPKANASNASTESTDRTKTRQAT
ncbi:hypothetical protein [Luteimonas granuli]|nr:hypothetical protein [Luteimonas granuli]